MAIKVVSDVHGEFQALARQLESRDTLIMLGDHINLVDFSTLEGILAEVYSREEIMMALSELAKGNKDIAKRTIREIAEGSGEKHRKVQYLIRESYRELFQSLPCKTLMLFGNVDNPFVMRDMAPDIVRILDGQVVDIDGETFGFVSGTPRLPWSVGLPGEREREVFDAAVDELGPVDVLCAHVPPAVNEVTFDVVADRDEVGSEKLRWYIEEYQPEICYFGHVHNPRVANAKLGKTLLINAGFFRRYKKVVVHSPGNPVK